MQQREGSARVVHLFSGDTTPSYYIYHTICILYFLIYTVRLNTNMDNMDILQSSSWKQVHWCLFIVTLQHHPHKTKEFQRYWAFLHRILCFKLTAFLNSQSLEAALINSQVRGFVCGQQNTKGRKFTGTSLGVSGKKDPLPPRLISQFLLTWLESVGLPCRCESQERDSGNEEKRTGSRARALPRIALQHGDRWVSYDWFRLLGWLRHQWVTVPVSSFHACACCYLVFNAEAANEMPGFSSITGHISAGLLRVCFFTSICDEPCYTWANNVSFTHTL